MYYSPSSILGEIAAPSANALPSGWIHMRSKHRRPDDTPVRNRSLKVFGPPGGDL